MSETSSSPGPSISMNQTPKNEFMEEMEYMDDEMMMVKRSTTLQNDEAPGDSEEEEEEEEPRLKYERLSSDLKRILENDSVSNLGVHGKFIVLGSHWGVLHMLDANGNSIPTQQHQPHSLAVTGVSIDHVGEFVASSSADGRVIINGLYSQENNLNILMDHEVKSIAIDPIYARSGSGRRFMTGEEKVILHEKTYFNRYKQTVISGENEGPIPLITWRGRFAAWCCRKGVRVFDVIALKTISLIKSETSYDRLNIPTRIAWTDQFNLIVAQGDSLKVCSILKREEPSNLGGGPTLPDYFCQISNSFILDDTWICGIAPMESKQIIILTMPKDQSNPDDPNSYTEDINRPLIMVIQPTKFSEFTLVSTDVLSVKGYKDYKPKDYHVKFLLEDSHYFIVSPKDVILGKPRDQDDHIEFLVSHRKFKEALEIVSHSTEVYRNTVLSVGRVYLDHLLKTEEFSQAGSLCLRILGRDKKLWQEEIFKCAKIGQLKVIAPWLPVKEMKLDSHIYEMILFEFLKASSIQPNDPNAQGFLDLIRDWPPDLYNISAVVNAVVEQLLMAPDNELLLRSLATLFSYQRKYDKAMAMYLKLGHQDVFELIRKHSLYHSVHDKIELLFELDHHEATKLFIENIDKISPDLIVSKLNYSKYLFWYLDSIKDRENSRKYHGKLLSLYADFEPDKLLSFLKYSDHYPIQEALEITEIRGLTHERIYILARMGNTRTALELITTELADIHQAVEFCKEHDDYDLWTDLINYSLDKPYFINVLLHNIGTHVDPRILIKKIEPGQTIPGLRDSLVQIMHDYRLQVSLQEGCKKILVSDCYNLLSRQVKTQNHGVSVESETTCGVCNVKIINEVEIHYDVIVFMCRHAFHLECLPETNLCVICSNDRKRK